MGAKVKFYVWPKFFVVGVGLMDWHLVWTLIASSADHYLCMTYPLQRLPVSRTCSSHITVPRLQQCWFFFHMSLCHAVQNKTHLSERRKIQALKLKLKTIHKSKHLEVNITGTCCQVCSNLWIHLNNFTNTCILWE